MNSNNFDDEELDELLSSDEYYESRRPANDAISYQEDKVTANSSDPSAISQPAKDSTDPVTIGQTAKDSTEPVTSSQTVKNSSDPVTSSQPAKDSASPSPDTASKTDPLDDREDSRKDKKKKRRGLSPVSIVILVIAAGVFIFAAVNLIKIFLDYRKADIIYEDVESTVLKDEQTSKVVITGDGSTSNEEVEIPFSYDDAALKSINSDGVGYLYIPAINVRLPIAQNDDNDFYLHHAFTGDYSDNGCLFIDSRITDGLNSTNVIIYGHNMNNGSMFGKLYYFRNESTTKYGDNSYIYIYTGNVVRQYRIFSVYVSEPISDTYTYNFPTLGSLQEYAAKMKSYSMYEMDTDVSETKQVLTLSTCCDNGERRLIVQASYIGEANLQ